MLVENGNCLLYFATLWQCGGPEDGAVCTETCRRAWINTENKGEGRGKVHLITGYEGPEVEYSISSLSLTSALDGSGWSTPRPGRFNLGKDPVPTM